jgi:hypothetical protein
MSRREARGQRVKTYKFWIPQPDLIAAETQIVVYFKADESRFYIYEGAHVLEAVGHFADKMGELLHCRVHGGNISSPLIDNLMKGFEALCDRYVMLLREQGKKRVIRFTFARNRPYVEGSPHKPASDISFSGAPALHFDFDMLWRVGDKLYRQSRPDDPLQFAGSVARSRGLHGESETCVDWTPEREAFFTQMRGALIETINRIEVFQSDLEQNVGLALARGTSPLMIEHKHGGEARG